MLKMEIDWWRLKDLAAKYPASYEVLRANHAERNPNDHFVPLEDILAGKGFHSFTAYINDPATLPDDVLEFAKFTALRPLKLVNDGGGESISGKKLAEAITMNQVHLPGNELLQINLVEVREDQCTEDLQRDLEDGWRIIAVIPRAGQRRPDYVLGKRGPF